MKGQVLDFSIQTNSGIISGDDQNRYHFNGAEWRDHRNPLKGTYVDFGIDAEGGAVCVYVMSGSGYLRQPNYNQGQKDRTTATILSFFLGGIGIHKFYLGSVSWGIIYLLFFWTLIPAIAAFIEFIIYLCMSDEDFARKYG